MRTLTKEEQEQLKIAAQNAVKAGWPKGINPRLTETYRIQMSKSPEKPVKEKKKE